MKLFVKAFYLVLVLALPLKAIAGNLDSPGAPSSGSGMPTLQGIYDQLNTGTVAATAPSFQEPSAGPTTGTGKTLTEIKSKLPSPDNTNGAAASDVLNGKTFWGLRTDGTWGPSTGTASAGADISGTNGSLTISIPDAFYFGGKTATASDTNLTTANIRRGATIFGVAGAMTNTCICFGIQHNPAMGCGSGAIGGYFLNIIYGVSDSSIYLYLVDPAQQAALEANGVAYDINTGWLCHRD